MSSDEILEQFGGIFSHVTAIVDQRITNALPAHRRPAIKSITAFYEISTCDLYIRTAVREHDVRLWDIIGLSLGIKLLI